MGNINFVRWTCASCGNQVITQGEYPTFPKWSDGHSCTFSKLE